MLTTELIERILTTIPGRTVGVLGDLFLDRYLDIDAARNVAHQAGERIAKFTTAVFDLIPLGDDYHAQAPKTDPRYYYRPWKTILVRTVADGGESFYVQGDHRQTVPAVWKAAVGG